MDGKRWRTSAVFWCVLLVFAGLTFVYNLGEVKTYASNGGILLTQLGASTKESTFVEERTTKGYLIKTPGCTIPDLKEMDPLIRKYIFREEPIVCNMGLPPLFEANRTAIYLLQNSLEHYHVDNATELKCCYQYFKREKPARDQSDKQIVYGKTCHAIATSADIDPHEEYLRIKCQNKTNEIYKDFFSFVPIKTNETKMSIDDLEEQNKLNVLVVGIDAVSRLNFHRQMPKTAFYLNKLKAVELLGYNKIGDNTFPNLIVALTGHNEKELEKLCWRNSNDYFDDCDFIWNQYKQAGYTTAFGEDSAWMGMFYYMKKGFRQQPTDYFFDHFDMVSTNEIGNAHRLNVDQCIGSRRVHEVFLYYAENFARTMYENSKAFFAFFWSASLTHDYLNKPKLGDQDYLNMLFNLDEEGILNKTALIVMSDHGIRWGDIRSTYQGRMEERLPFLYIVLPEWYRNQNTESFNNLRTNTRRLTTPYDLYETFLDVLHQPDAIGKRTTTKRGISLFRPVPKNRTCSEAGIAPHWCTCQTSVQIDEPTEDVHKAVNYTIAYINTLLIGYADCYQLKLDEILEARELSNDNEMQKYKKSIRDYTLTFKTAPGGAIFEATVRKDAGQFAISGTVSRINLYGSQSKCISDFHLKLYCYCRSYFGN